MRAFEGQRSDNWPVKRGAKEKKVQLATLKARLAAIGPHESPALKASIQAKIAELEQELGTGGN